MRDRNVIRIERAVELGIQACRRGDYATGLRCLVAVADENEGVVELPGLFYSYLGVAIADQQERYLEAESMCKHAIRLQYVHPENHANLARVYMLGGRRRLCLKAIEKGLAIAPHHTELLLLREDLSVRQNPVLPFLKRSNPLNVTLGRWRHRLKNR